MDWCTDILTEIISNGGGCPDVSCMLCPLDNQCAHLIKQNKVSVINYVPNNKELRKKLAQELLFEHLL